MSIALLTFKGLQTVIATVDDNFVSENKIKLSKLLFVMSQPTQQGSQLVFVPFLEFSEQWETGIEFDRSEFTVISDPISSITEKYREMFSEIQIASAMPKWKGR
uniref:Uncharacterized protein n=1 Tax=viral metagenome TaxID=1070528 RepID=A0A6C0JX09_9ZZZZ